ncbi:KxYKxGKxW signal peptide domain-containing protein [Streptococcus salivarius]|jgi:glucan-binding repeat-containing protein|uniref:KxYKxGKxW signal peptide domain-containing protein n=1 Tax=Streptococcus salivarius TaxID=1304 RepID=UPI00232DB080|nr:KxYKxGKxW signal peptide domain-containing protein [Streptococcus salivarius]MDB8592705.1 KxYKxGKxW signal peptide domain-containing protein [Streptococcus salivarius]MDB8594708.1 KxYKxGKxW signal peptide domain-containing protein [Streptococcus salivarius]MDB8599604.1 KxYKxGKxW signal peptide domain-containing protein [Streptococcus salivarius]
MEKKVHFKLHKVKKHWVTIAVTGLTLGLSFAGLNYASAEEHPTPVNEATVEAIIKEGAIDVEAPATNEATAKPTENTPATASNEAATVSEAPVAASEVASTETVSEKLSSEVTSTASSEAASSETAHSEVSASPEVVEKTVVTGGQYTSDDQGNWYYVKDGKALTGLQTIDYVDVYFDADGKQVKDDTRQIDGSTYHFAKDSGQITRNAFASDKMGNWYYFGPDGKALTGKQIVDNFTLYFYPNGVQAKDAFVILDGNTYYFQKDSGQLVSNRYWSDDEGNWYYSDKDGRLLIGAQTVDFINVYFYDDGVQVKGDFAPNGHYYDKDTGALVTNRYVEKDGKWYYVNDKGDKLVGQQTVDGVEVYFNKDGVQAKGIFANADHFYDKDTGAAVRDQIVEVDGKRYYVGPDGRKVYSGTHIVHGEEVNLIVGDGHQAFGEFTGHGDSGDYIGFDGKKVTKAGFVRTKDNHWYYLDGKGGKLVSVQVIDGELYYFGLPTRKYYYGMQSRGELIYAHYSDLTPYRTHIYYLNESTGAALKNQYHEWEGSWYYFGPNWYALTGEQTIDNVPVYFHSNGKQAKGELVTVDGKIHYYDANSGARLSNITITIKGQTYHFDADGNGTPIS